MTLTITPPSMGGGNSWNPEVGKFTKQFLDSRKSAKKPIKMETVLSEAQSILGHCVPPSANAGEAAVLVVGYVQSGKTLSFTTLASLARDNGFGMVILLAGTTNNLKDQSQRRLEADLGLDKLQRGWVGIFENPAVTGSDFLKMRTAVKSWQRQKDGRTQEEKPALVVSLLKHAGRLEAASDALRRLDLNNMPVLIIDDESDQATPNTKANKNRRGQGNDESATYAAVLALRSALPHHSYVQYTATPQANLLLATTDSLNPDYAKVLSSGEEYTGGKVFFQDRVDDLIKVVPDSESYDPRNPLGAPPEGLQDALRVFLLGVADAGLKKLDENRSMMIQAHQNTAPHQVYRKWIQAMLADWQEGLDAQGADGEEVHADFAPAFTELSRTVSGLATFNELMAELPERLAELQVVEVNSTAQAEKNLKWNSAHNWILIGGMKLDRGFTVEGLTVTYMPRPLTGNADVLQQRARFFGYRGRFIDYCRVYLLNSAKEAFVDYVDDEESLRESLKVHEGRPLSEWKRNFILHGQFSSPTRSSVIGRRSIRKHNSREWIWPGSMHIGEAIRSSNLNLFSEAMGRFKSDLVDANSLPGAIDRRGTDHNLVRVGVALDDALDFLIRLRFGSGEDSLLIGALARELARIVREPREGDPTSAAFVFMSGLNVPTGPGRQLSVLRKTLHVGRNPKGALPETLTYSGDDTFKSEEELTIQMRVVRLTDAPPSGENYSKVPWIAVSMPRGLSHDLFLE